MTVKELIDVLKKYDENYEVILSSDEEGNSFNELSIIEEGCYDFRDKERIDGYITDCNNSIFLYP